MHTTGHLARRVEPGDGFVVGPNAGAVRVNQQATHAVVDHWCDDGHVEGFMLHARAWQNVVEKLLAAACLAARLIMRLAGGIGRPLALLRMGLSLLGRLVMLLVSLLQHVDVHAHVLGQIVTCLVVLHHPATGVVLAVPNDLLGGGLVQAQPEGRLALPHLARHVVATAQLIAEALALGVEDDSTHSTEGLGGQELDLGIRVIGLHQTRGMHLNPFQVDALGPDGLAHLDAVAGAVLAVGGGQMQQVWAVLRQQRVAGEVCAEAA